MELGLMRQLEANEIDTQLLCLSLCVHYMELLGWKLTSLRLTFLFGYRSAMCITESHGDIYKQNKMCVITILRVNFSSFFSTYQFKN